MEAQSYTAEERRAANQVWAAAGAYGFEPLFLARNTDGTIDFYMNCVVGLVHKYYGDELVRSLFDAWEGDIRQAMLDDLAWLYLENAAYRLELPHRPVLEALRYSHADYFFAIQYKLSRQEWMARNQLVYTMQAARWRSVLGRNLPVMTPYESGLFRALAPDTAPQPDQLQDALLAVYAKFDLFDGTVHPKAALHLHLDGLLATLATKALPTQMIKTDRVTVEHSNAVDAAGSGPSVDKRQAHITLKQNAAQDRAYIESCFGRSLYPPERLRKAEQELCVGDHLGCHLWFSAGVPSPEQAPTPEAKHLAEQAELQADRNRAYDAKNRELHRSVVLRLTEQIQNCILVHQQPNARIARSGNLDPERVWRTVMDDDRVFRCAEEENHPSFTVDLLLDASASRLHCQEVIAAQGSILAQSLAAWNAFAQQYFPALADRPAVVHGGGVLLPAAFPQTGLHVLRAGVFVGSVQKGRFVPEHHLFTAFGAQCANREELTLADPRCVEYLSGREVEARTAADGWCCVTVDGWPLGGGKVSGGRVKNHYPKALRLL